MFVARHKETGKYLRLGNGIRHPMQVPLTQARVYRSEQGARASITYGSPTLNGHLLHYWEIIPITVATQEENNANQ